MKKGAIVITTINNINENIRKFHSFSGWDVVIVGDKKTPEIDVSGMDGMRFVSTDDQERDSWGLSEALPFNHYARKNIGYLEALDGGYERIADTDDDNFPYDDWDGWIEQDYLDDVISAPKFPNVYSLFTDEHVWPRGYPLSEVRTSNAVTFSDAAVAREDIGVIQGLADIEPDVDAIYRLVLGDKVTFDQRDPVALDDGVYSAFNSQNTLWASEVAPFLYLPATVRFRFTDILRSYVAQRGLWALGKRVAFTDATVKQDRNPHDLMRDFESEIPCYNQTTSVVEILDELTLRGIPSDDLQKMYEALEVHGIVEERERPLVDTWLRDIKTIK